MKPLYFVLLWIALTTATCSKKNNDKEKDTYGYFSKHLRADMTYDELLQTFGQWDTQMGSGIHIYAYHLSDGTSIWIGYADKIIYARHQSKDGELLHTII
jgi:hypothetical protein